jgi:hypothetical protein
MDSFFILGDVLDKRKGFEVGDVVLILENEKIA